MDGSSNNVGFYGTYLTTAVSSTYDRNHHLSKTLFKEDIADIVEKEKKSEPLPNCSKRLHSIDKDGLVNNGLITFTICLIKRYHGNSLESYEIRFQYSRKEKLMSSSNFDIELDDLGENDG